MVDKIKRAFGWPTVAVYTEEATILDNIDTAFSMLSDKVLRQTSFVLPPKGVNRLNKEEVPIIFKVEPYTGPQERPSFVFDVFTLTESIEYFSLNSANGILTPLLATVLRNQVNNAFGRKFDWKYERSSGILYATNIPQQATLLAVEGKVRYTFDTLTTELETWIYKYAYAMTCLVEGRIRSKFKDSSSALVSDGEALVSEGKEQMPNLEQELQNFVPLNIGVRK